MWATYSVVTGGTWDFGDGSVGTWIACLGGEGYRWISQDGTTEGGWTTDYSSGTTGTWWSDDNNQAGTWYN